MAQEEQAGRGVAPPSSIIGYCRCGQQVWAGALPLCTETVLCPSCGRDCSIRPTLEERTVRARGLMRKRRRVEADMASQRPLRGLPFVRVWLRSAGVWFWWVRKPKALVNCFRMPYEIHGKQGSE